MIHSGINVYELFSVRQILTMTPIRAMTFYHIVGVVLLVVILFLSMKLPTRPNEFAYYAPADQAEWWKRSDWERFGYPSYSYWEGFENKGPVLTEKKDDAIMKYRPGEGGPANLYNNQPYHLLNDELSPPRVKESISCVNSRSCYATDFQRMVEKTGTYRQFTNNYKRNYPDSCSSPYQELVLNFYKTSPMPIPPNNTGESVSEAL